MRWLNFLVAAASITAVAACSDSKDGSTAAGGAGGGTAMTGDPIGDSGVCFGDPTDLCAVCRCTYCGVVTAACVTDRTCADAESTFKNCAARVAITEIAQCRDPANAASAKAGPYLDCLVAVCADKCL
jgi:hypothetical protein